MKRSELVACLNKLPDIDVTTDYGFDIIGVSESSYDDDNGTHDCIAIEVSED